jgi:hypothetical protein
LLKLLAILLSVSFSISVQAAPNERRTPQGRQAYPTSPAPHLTPGTLCERPSSKRYAEGIPYCERDVHSDLKREVMETYDRELGYQVTKMARGLFKIDHFIPLCMGGSNQAENLWPQHESVYTITDDIEHLSCELMSKGKLRQAEAVAGIREAKLDLARAPAVLARLKAIGSR